MLISTFVDWHFHSPGSVVCNFKIKYILKEAFAVVPFTITPSTITNSLGQSFHFKRGILFQRFVIATGSFKASSKTVTKITVYFFDTYYLFPLQLLADENMFFEGPVDHCDAKGCSHKCSYNYDFEDYVCTCPRHLVLGEDGHTCEPRQDGEQPPSDNASGQSSFHTV